MSFRPVVRSGEAGNFVGTLDNCQHPDYSIRTAVLLWGRLWSLVDEAPGWQQIRHWNLMRNGVQEKVP